MKRKLTWVAVAPLLCASVAHAQSSVTLYGLIDEGLNFTSNAGGKRGYTMISGDTAGSRWGLKGREDLGSGLAAVFQLENGFNLNNGQFGNGGGEFSRQAYVGLSSRDYGTVTLGRQYDPTVDLWSGFTATGNAIGDLASHPFDNDNADYDYRINNAIKYVSPNYHGIVVDALYGFSNAAGGFATNRVYSAAVSYALGQFSAAAGYFKVDNGNATATGALAQGIFTGRSQQNIVGGAKWTFANKANVALAYSHVDVYGPTVNGYIDTGDRAWNAWKFDNVELNGQYYFRPDLSLTAAYAFTHAHLEAQGDRYSPNWHQVSMMLSYNFSPRTSVYLQGAWQHATGKTGTEFDVGDIVGSAGTSSGPNQMVYRIGMMHRF